MGCITKLKRVYEKVRNQNSNRWSREIRNWNPVHQVWLNPKRTDETNQIYGLKKAA